MRIAVLSDLHFGSERTDRSHTHVVAGESAVPRQHPFNDLLAMVRRETLVADAVLCPGDMTLRADKAGLAEAWRCVNDLAAALGAEHVLAATGNHDISSRLADNSDSPEIWERLKQLSPSYPYPQGEPLHRLRYFAEHFFSVEIEGVRIFVLNTCNCHARGEAEYAHGRVTDYTIELLREAVAVDTSAAFDILLCHHHPVRHPELDQLDSDYSEMIQGRRLLEVLENSDRHWLVVHGHKHKPRIEYAQGAGDVPVIFSAGSFSAVLPPTYYPNVTNQFYVLDFDLSYIRENGVAGTVNSWDWAQGTGWVRASKSEAPDARIISGAGFGHRYNPSDARYISGYFADQNAVSWESVVRQFPHIKYLTTKDLQRLVRDLQRASWDARWVPGESTPTTSPLN